MVLVRLPTPFCPQPCCVALVAPYMDDKKSWCCSHALQAIHLDVIPISVDLRRNMLNLILNMCHVMYKSFCTSIMHIICRWKSIYTHTKNICIYILYYIYIWLYMYVQYPHLWQRTRDGALSRLVAIRGRLEHLVQRNPWDLCLHVRLLAGQLRSVFGEFVT